MKLHYLTLAAVIIPLGCVPGPFRLGQQDFTAQLPGNYYVHRTSSHQIVIAPASYDDNTPIIPEKVVELDHDEHFLIAKQQLLERRSPNDPNDSYEQPKPNAFQYWILDLGSANPEGIRANDPKRIRRSTNLVGSANVPTIT